MYTISAVGRGGRQVVSMLAFYSIDLRLNPTEAYSFSVKFVFEKNENKQKEAGVGPFLKKCTNISCFSNNYLPLIILKSNGKLDTFAMGYIFNPNN